MSVREIVVCADKRSLALAAAQFVKGEIALGSDRRFLLALSGGTTPALLYDTLASDRFNNELFSSRCEIFFSDERAVGPDHPDSNYRLANERLFEPLGIAPGIIHRMKGEETDLEAEAARYASLIRAKSGCKPPGIPSLDLVLLGMGDDGHTASLFPGFDLTRPNREIVLALWIEKLNSHRLSFSMDLINAAGAALILVSGAQKAGAVKLALDSSIQQNRLPAGQVAAARTVWMLDVAAARDLNWTGRVLSI